MIGLVAPSIHTKALVVQWQIKTNKNTTKKGGKFGEAHGDDCFSPNMEHIIVTSLFQGTL
jgi:hypothetical protein